MKRMINWLGVLVGGSILFLAGCGGWGRAYLDGAVGKANQEEVRAELGTPDKIARKDGGQTLWIYDHCIIPSGCHVWNLTFDRNRVLQEWERVPEHL